MALKNPNGDFVEMDSGMENSYTKQIPIIDDTKIEYKKRNQNPEIEKGKIGQFLTQNPRVKIILGISLFIIIPLIALFLTMAIINSTKLKNVQIPNLVGMTSEQANEELKKLKINYIIESEEYNNDVESGKIISQDPKYKDNFTVLEKSTIKVKISKGPETVLMPKVAGMKYEEAENVLKKLNIKV